MVLGTVCLMPWLYCNVSRPRDGTQSVSDNVCHGVAISVLQCAVQANAKCFWVFFAQPWAIRIELNRKATHNSICQKWQSLPLGCLLVNGQKHILMIFRTSGLFDFWTQSVPTQEVELVLFDMEGLGNPLLKIVAIYAVAGQGKIECGVNAHHLGICHCCWAQDAWQAVQGGVRLPIRLKAHLALLSVEWGLIALDGPVPAICYVPPWDATHPPHCDAKWQCDSLTPVWGISILYRDYLRCEIHKE